MFSSIMVDKLEAKTDTNIKDAVENVTLNVINTSGNYSSIYMVASGVSSQHYVGNGIHFIGTNTAHSIHIGANRFVSGAAVVFDTSGNTGYYGSTYSASDNRLKDEQKNVDEDACMNVLRSITPKTYKRNDRNNESRLGFIAQEVEAVIPKEWSNIVSNIEKIDEVRSVGDTITLENTTTMKSLDYSRLCTILWSVCKNLDRRITELENKLNQ